MSDFIERADMFDNLLVAAIRLPARRGDPADVPGISIGCPPSPGFAPCAILIWISSALCR
jgi:hypothetical protein